MPSTPKSVKRNIRQLIFIPALTSIVLLSVCLASFLLYELSKFVDMRGKAMTHKTAQLLYMPLIKHDNELVQTLLDGSLEDPYIRALHVHLDATNESFHSGPQFLLTENIEQRANSISPTKQETNRTILFSYPITDKNGLNPIGWVEVEMLSSAYMVVHYQTILIAIAISLLCLLIGDFLASNLFKSINDPLNHIKQVINKLAKGELQTRIKPQDSNEFIEIAGAINEMAASLETAQQDLQNHIEQSTQDLIETLETIEIKNIELDIARKEAIEGSRVKSEFLANTSHEIRTPLNGILGFVSLALKTDMDEQQTDYLNTIRGSAENLLSVINGILDFSKLEAGKLTLEYAPLRLRQTIDDTLHMLAPAAHEKNLQLITHVNSNIPSDLLGDTLRFKQVLSNLVNNAIKFSHKGNIIVRVNAIASQETHLMLKVTVSDQGKGIAKEQQQELFKPFFQTDASNSREHGGTGLGLAICKGLVERMNGEIGVESQINEGSTFWFTVRLGIEKRKSHQLTSPCLYYHALICGSDKAASEQLQSLLQEWQMKQQTIQEIHDIFPVIRQAQKNTPIDLLIIDVAPGEHKIQPVLLNSINEQLADEFDCKVIICCTAEQQRFFRSGGQNVNTTFINKPVSHDGLLKTICKKLNISLNELRADSTSEANELRPTPSVLLVDDNPANLQLASELLRGLNTNVTQASSGLQAIESCKNTIFDMIFMDIQMPGMDGFETTRQIRKIEGDARRTPIIALTAHSIADQKTQLLIAGMDDCVGKPVNENQLAHIINKWCYLDDTNEIIKQDTTIIEHEKIFSIDSNSLVKSKSISLIEPQDFEKNNPVSISLCLKLANNKPALARDMLTMMIASLPTEKKAINQAVANNNMEDLAELIHRMYGSCCYCGVPRLKSISCLIDKLLTANEHKVAIKAIATLNLHIDDIIQWGEEKNLNAVFNLKSEAVLNS